MESHRPTCSPSRLEEAIDGVMNKFDELLPMVSFLRTMPMRLTTLRPLLHGLVTCNPWAYSTVDTDAEDHEKQYWSYVWPDWLLHNPESIKTVSETLWASHSDLQAPGDTDLIGKRIRLGNYDLHVQSYVSEGKSARTFMVAVDMPANNRGDQLILKVEKLEYPLCETVSDEAELMRKVEGVAHAVQMVAHGNLRVPGDFSNLFFEHKSSCSAMLVKVAPGKKLIDVMDSMTHVDREVAMSQLWEFANDMLARGISHADLTPENVFWDPAAMKITVIDFGNAFVWSDKPTGKQLIKQRLIGNANREMCAFLEVKLEWT